MDSLLLLFVVLGFAGSAVLIGLGASQLRKAFRKISLPILKPKLEVKAEVETPLVMMQKLDDKLEGKEE